MTNWRWRAGEPDPDDDLDYEPDESTFEQHGDVIPPPPVGLTRDCSPQG